MCVCLLPLVNHIILTYHTLILCYPLSAAIVENLPNKEPVQLTACISCNLSIHHSIWVVMNLRSLWICCRFFWQPPPPMMGPHWKNLSIFTVLKLYIFIWDFSATYERRRHFWWKGFNERWDLILQKQVFCIWF